MKINKLTSALIALGVVSVASVSQAQTVVYLTGSSAARATIYQAMVHSGEVFPAGPTHVYDPDGKTTGANIIAYEGVIPGLGDTVINCSFSGSEAGISAVAGQSLKQTLPGDPNGSGPYNLPGSPASFMNAPYTSTANVTVNTLPDLSMADTSQAVSRTPKSLYNLHDYGIVGVVTFTIMKAYDSNPDAAYTRLTNVTTPTLYQALKTGDSYNASNFTGNNADTSDGVAIVGRNFGSGTRANSFLNAFNYGLTVDCVQYAMGTLAQLYPAGPNAGNLQLSGSYASGQTLTSVGNDGYDSGGNVGKTLNIDWTGQGVIGIGYIGTADAYGAWNTPPSGGGKPVYLKFNGVYESDAAVENGAYTYWGSEHLYGNVTPSTAANDVAAQIKSGLAAELTRSSAGLATGDVSTNPNQSNIIPTSLMLVTRGGQDYGYPAQGSF